jgi:hypothetical protein
MTGIDLAQWRQKLHALQPVPRWRSAPRTVTSAARNPGMPR